MDKYPRVMLCAKVLGVVVSLIALYLIVDVGREISGAEGRTLHIFSLWLMNSYIMFLIWWRHRDR